MSEILLETKNLSVDFPVKGTGVFSKRKYVRAVTDISLQIRRGETFGLVGESGCGKSTFANATIGLQPPASGSVLFGGQELYSLPKKQFRAERRRMQKIFQDPLSSLNPRFNVLELVSEPLVIRGGFTKGERAERAAEMLESVGLGAEDLYRYPSDFSGGQRQRIAIARALILRPEYLVCDEPVSALDVSVHAQILNLLCDLQKSMGITYLFISHNLAAVRKLCDHVAIMYLGRVVESGCAEKIFANPLHPYTKALLSAVLDTDPDRKRQRVTLKGDVSSPVDPPPGCRFCKRCPEARENCESAPCPLTEAGEEHFVACPYAL